MPKLINWEIISQPYNWIIIAVIVAFAALAANVLWNGGSLTMTQQG